jgi:LacI family transcriptional regulator
MNQKSLTCGLMTDVVLTTPYSYDLVRGVQAEISSRGHICLIVSTDDSPYQEESLWRAFHEHKVQGVIYASMHHRAHVLSDSSFKNHMVLANCFSVGIRAPCVLPDDAGGGYIQAKHILELGHRRIGVISLIGELPATRLRDVGMRRAFAEVGVTLDESLYVPGFAGSTRQEVLIAYDAARTLLSQSDRPSAIICGNDQIAMQVYAAAASLNLSIPEDLSVIGFDNFKFVAETLMPKLTTVALPYFDIGKKAVELINTENVAEQKTLLPCTLVERQSCKRIN